MSHVICILQSLKLSAIKGDSRFTTTCQLVKLIGSHTISRVTLRIADLKRQKMVGSYIVKPGFIRVMENLESHGILQNHFPGLESHGI